MFPQPHTHRARVCLAKERKVKKSTVYKILYAVAAALAVAFAVFFIVDACAYNPMENSAPLSAYALVRALQFLLPSAVAFTVAVILKKKWRDER